jgi:dUTP pyrophosphatase
MKMKIVNKSNYDLPKYQTKGSAGFDIKINIDAPLKISKHSITELLPTGLYVKIPDGYEGEIRPRSGLACKHGITLANSPATIDSDYTGEIKICLVNNSKEDYILSPGERVCQMLIKPVIQVEFEEVETLEVTERGSDGFGSTGNL